MVGTYFNKRLKRGLQIESSSPLDQGVEFFSERITIKRDQANAQVVIPADRVGPNRKVQILGYLLQVGGATAWVGGTSIILQDTASSPAAVLTVLTAALTANALNQVGGTLVNAGQTATANLGLQVALSGTFTAGSDVIMILYGIIA